MITLEIEQGTAEWFTARAGKPSASCFDKLLTSKAEPSKQRDKYLRRLAGELVIGRAAESFSNGPTDRGNEMEAEARNLYELLKDIKIKQVGLCFPDEKRLCAASPDGLCGEDGLIEIKCPLIETHVEYLLDGVLPTEYFQQIQGQLYVTGRKWVDFVSYYPGLKPLIVRVEPDKKFQAALAVEIEVCNKLIQDIVSKIK